MDGAHSSEVSLNRRSALRGRVPSPLRALKALVFVAIGIALAYLIAANAFLAFGTPLLFEGTNQVNATFRRAWSIYPGTVHVRDLRVTFQDHNVQFELDLPVADMDIRLRELGSRTLHATRVRGQQVRFAMRHRIQPESKDELWVGALPKIVGFADPPLFEARVPSPPIPDDQYDLWTIHLEDVDVRVAEIWVQFVRYRGAGVAKGSFRLRPARHLWVTPASLEIENGSVHIGQELLAAGLTGRIDCVVHPFDVRIPVGNQAFREISAGLSLQATGLRLEPMASFFEASFRPRIRSVPGELFVDARLERGVMTETSRIRLEVPELALEHDRWLASARELRTRFNGMPGTGAELWTTWSAADLKIRNSTLPPLETGAVAGFLVSSSRDTTAQWEMTRAGIDVSALRLANLGWVNAASPRVTQRLSGALTLDGKAQYEMGVLDADASLRLAGARAREGEVVLGLDGALDLQLSRARMREHSGRLVARLRGKTARIAAGSADFSAANLAVNADIQAEHGRARGLVEGTLGRLAAKAEQLRFAGNGRVKVVLDALDTRTLAAKGSTALALSDVSARQETLSIAAERFDLSSDFERSGRGVWNARLETMIRGFSGGSKTLSFAAEPKIVGRIAEYDPESDTGWFEGDLRIRDFRAAGRDQSAACPVLRVSDTRLHARVDLDPGGNRGLVDASVADARFDWGDFRASFGSEISAHFEPRPNATASKVDFTARGREVRFSSGPGGTQGWDARVPALAVSGVLDVDRLIRGSVRIETSQAESRIGQSRIQTDVSAALGLSAVDLERGQGRFEGAVRLENATVRAGEHSVSGWWAGVELGSALVTVGHNLDLSTLFRAELRDATPGLVALSAEDALPSWLVAVLPLRALNVHGSINRRCRLTDIHFTQVQGGPLEGSGRLQSVPDAVRGAFLVRLADFGALSAGIRFDPESTRVKLFAGDSWLQTRHTALDDSVRAVLEKPCTPAPSECTVD